MRERAGAPAARSGAVPGWPLDAQGTWLGDAVLLGQAEDLGGTQALRVARPGRIRHGRLAGQGAAGRNAASRTLVVPRRARRLLMAKAGGGVCRGTRTGERAVSVLRLKGDPGRRIIVVRTRMMMTMVRVGL